ncbi:phosphatidylserine lipase ABHD16A isoform X3 [Neopsephotus bourkii]|uniref:phosphatidylserine lipase ABHD16A isoform X3 n=1 Tax=Neopsephotus bourkii TaxID=309878 RepID=UPI002AA50AB2|nr:phosphatidylserine lipase ABHD16A isoform X3 [Neopsephotus bourkii]
MAKLLSCVLGPRLYRVHRPRPAGTGTGAGTGAEGPGGSGGDPAWDSYYQPRGLEKHTDSVLALASVLWSISYYASPLAVFYLYRKGLLTMSRVIPMSHCAATVVLLLAGVACLRGIGRWSNPQYVEFISVLEDSHRLGTPEVKRKLAHYTFDFRSWPIDFRWDSTGVPWGGSRDVPLLRTPPGHRGAARGFLGALRKVPCRLASLLLAHTLGRRMLFPGSVRLLQKALLPSLLQGQARLVEECGGQRAKLLACDGNEIDTMFIDRRHRAGPHGSTLVICCEGNAGFYEVGCLCTPLEAGYSVLGWNHPGFGGSTGVPLPQSEANAMDVVVRFALQELRFPPRSIVIYAWSIGGFTGELVTRTVREHLNLNNAEQLCRYQGPVLLVRRTRDEIITTTVPEDIASNRGNDLLLKLLQHRYPKIMADEGTRIVREWLEAATPAEERALAQRCPVDECWCHAVLEAFAGDRDPPFPWSLGEELSVEERQQLALFLAQKHLQNFEASHCTPLPPQAFRLPWTL